MADRTQRFALISRFEKACKDREYPRALLNKNKEQWSADALLESYTFDELLEAMRYYFVVNSRPTWGNFANNVDKVLSAMETNHQDELLRAEMREKAKQWLT